jgi:hypothetical protein
MTNLSDLEINLDGMEESLKIIEKCLNEIIHNHELSPAEMRIRASTCVNAVNRYTRTANRNVRLLNDQAFYLLDKVRKIHEDTQAEYENKVSEYDIH